MQYLKELIFAFSAILLMSAVWAITLGVGPFFSWRLFHSDGAHALYAIGITALFCAITAYTKNRTQLFFGGAAFGAACGAFTSVLIWFSFAVIANASGFWYCAFLSFIGLILFAAMLAVVGVAVKSMIFALFKLDFLTILLCFMVGVVAFFGGMSVIVSAFQCHAAMGVLILVGLTGGASVVAGPAVSSDTIMDGNGNLRFISGNNADGSVTTTDGSRMRQMPDGNYKEF